MSTYVSEPFGFEITRPLKGSADAHMPFTQLPAGKDTPFPEFQAVSFSPPTPILLQ